MKVTGENTPGSAAGSEVGSGSVSGSVRGTDTNLSHETVPLKKIIVSHRRMQLKSHIRIRTKMFRIRNTAFCIFLDPKIELGYGARAIGTVPYQDTSA